MFVGSYNSNLNNVEWFKFTQILTNPSTIELKGVWLLAYPYIFTLELKVRVIRIKEMITNLKLLIVKQILLVTISTIGTVNSTLWSMNAHGKG